MPPTQTLSTPPLQLRAAVTPGTWNPATGELDVTFASNSRALKLDGWGDPFLEELDLSPEAVRMDRLNSGGPVLNAHGKTEHRGGTIPLEYQVGVVKHAKTDGKVASARIKIAEVASTEELRAKIDQGIVQGVSVGYLVHSYRDITTAEDPQRVLLAVDWEPFEITLVPIPEDFTVGLRSANSETCNPCLLEGPDFMTPEEKAAAAKAALLKAERERSLEIRSLASAAGDRVAPSEVDRWIKDGLPVVEVRTLIEALPAKKAKTNEPGSEGGAPAGDPSDPIAVERIRSLEIHRLGRVHKLTPTFVDDHLQRGTTLDSFRSLAMDQLADREDLDGNTRQHNSGALDVGEEEGTKLLRGMQMAVDHRAGLQEKNEAGTLVDIKLDDAGRKFRSMSLLEMGREALQIRGHSVAGTKMELAGRSLSHTAGDFPGILANTANKALRRAYEAVTPSWQAFASKGDATDFKTMSRHQLGDAPTLLPVGDSGEIERGSMGEASESYAIESYSRIVSLSRKTIVNDDLGAFTRIARAFGRSAADREAAVVWGLIIGNPVMGDGNQVFSAAHGNVGTGVISVANIGAGVAAMKGQKGVQNERNEAQFMEPAPSFLIVPTVLEFQALQFTTASTPNEAGKVNPYASSLSPISTPRFSSALEWYLFAAPSNIDVIEYAYLDGVEGPVFEQEEGFNIDGMSFKARLDFGAVVLDHRGLYRSSGA